MADRVDWPCCRVDLVQMAAAEGEDVRCAFDWIDDTQAIRVQNAAENQGYTALEIRTLAIEWILEGHRISCVPEAREGYKERRHFHYDITIGNLPDFPRGLYVEMELSNRDEQTPTVSLLNAHPQRA